MVVIYISACNNRVSLTERHLSAKLLIRLLQPGMPHTISIALSAILKGIRSTALSGNVTNALEQSSFAPSSAVMAA